MKKIAFFIYNMYTTGGTEKAVSLIANELSKKYEVKIFSLYQTAEKPVFHLNDAIELIPILGMELSLYRLRIPYLRKLLKKFFQQYDLDVFVSAGMKYVPITSFMSKRCRYIAWEHYNSYDTVMGSITWYGRRIACKKADGIVVLTKEDKDNYCKLFQVSPSKVFNIFNPMETKTKDIVYNEQSKAIVSCGRLVSIKGFDMLIDVAQKVFSTHTDWKWDIYGEGQEKDNLQKKINDYHLENHVILKGNVSNMDNIYHNYSFLVLTSRSEGLGLVLNEAHQNKLPIVSFDCPYGPRNVIENDVNGYLIECFDTEAMAEKINYLIDNVEARKSMAEKTNFDKDKFKIENIINEWENII